MEGMDVPVGVVSEALFRGRAEAVEKDGCVSAHFLLVHV